MYGKLSEVTDNFLGVQGSLGYIFIIVAVVIGYSWTSAAMFPADQFKDSKHPSNKHHQDEDEDVPDPPRNFTQKQLLYFDGTKDEKTGEDKPVYLSVNGIVFDVTDGRAFYGPDGPYSKFAGHECGIALAKMSFDEEYLDDIKGIKDLNFGERTELDNWIEKFQYYRCYPVLGRLVLDLPDPNRLLTLDDISIYNGSITPSTSGNTSKDENNDSKDETNDTIKDDTDTNNTILIPEGYATAPIYIAADDKVFDMSFGGVTFYGNGGPYNKFAGRNVTRALALMSLDEKDLNQHNDISDCTEKQIQTMKDWVKTFEDRKGYPIVGRLKK